MRLRNVLVGMTCCMFSTVNAGEELPRELAGSGTVATGRTSVTPWSIAIESQSADGVITGKMNWHGRLCIAKDHPFTGSYRDRLLEFSAPEIDPKCGEWTAKLKQTSASEFAFEGSLSTTVGGTASVVLKPR